MSNRWDIVKIDRAILPLLLEMHNSAGNANRMSFGPAHHVVAQVVGRAPLLRRSVLSIAPRFRWGVPHYPDRELVSSPRHIARSERISRTTRSCTVHIKGYGVDRSGHLRAMPEDLGDLWQRRATSNHFGP